jgi:hypothetical protein
MRMSRGQRHGPKILTCLCLLAMATVSVRADSPTTQPTKSPTTRPSVADQFRPLGVRSLVPNQNGAGISPGSSNADQNDFYPVPDRWRVGIPGDYVQNTRNDTIFDPYGQNVLKGDYPILGQDKFLILTLTSDTIYEARKLPTASGISTARPGSLTFFGQGDSQLLTQDFVESAEFFQGDADYRPRDWSIKETGVFEYDYLHANELGVVDSDVRDKEDRQVSFFGFQELFAEYKIADVSPNFDIMSIRVGIQDFNNDFRGFLFDDQEPGVRLFGNLESNKIQYNLAAFYMLEKNTNTGLNTFNSRDQGTFFANVFNQDFIWPGYTAELSAAANFDNPDLKFDDNGSLVRPEPIGTISEKAVRAYYIGFGGDGHIGRFNLDDQFYEALGEESYNAIAGRKTEINAQFGAVELSYDQDYGRYRASFVYASGDSDPTGRKATGFDSIFDNPNFFGGGFDLFTRQAIALLNTKVNLVNRNSFLPDLRTSKEEGQANFDNPGLLAYNLGYDYDLTPTTSLITNATYLQFDDTQVLQLVEHDDRLIDHDIGIDYSLGIRFRPLLNNNIIFTVGLSFLTPFAEFQKLYSAQTLYSTFGALTFTY